MHKIFHSTSFSFSWMYSYGMTIKNRVRRSLTDFAENISMYSFKDVSLQRNVVKLSMLNDARFNARFFDVEPGFYELLIRVRISKLQGNLVPKTIVILKWKDAVPSLDYMKMDPESDRFSLTECRVNVRELIITSNDWKELLILNGNHWFNLKVKNIDVFSPAIVEIKFRNEISQSFNVLFMDYVELVSISRNVENCLDFR